MVTETYYMHISYVYTYILYITYIPNIYYIENPEKTATKERKLNKKVQQLRIQ